jgi:hypothetical protein
MPVLAGCAVAGLFALFVWPTPYTVAHRDAVGFGSSEFVRVNRLTGVTELATDHGWRTAEQIIADDDMQRIQRHDRITADLDALKIDDDGQSFKTLAVDNPSNWQLGSKSPSNTTVEYFTYRNDGTKSFIAKQQCVNASISSTSHSMMDACSTSGLPHAVNSLPAYEPIDQRITVTFDMARNTVTSGPTDAPIGLTPPFVLHTDRYWYAATPLTPQRKTDLQAQYDALKSSGAVARSPELSLWLRGMRCRNLVTDNSATSPACKQDSTPDFRPSGNGAEPGGTSSASAPSTALAKLPPGDLAGGGGAESSIVVTTPDGRRLRIGYPAGSPPPSRADIQDVIRQVERTGPVKPKATKK